MPIIRQALARVRPLLESQRNPVERVLLPSAGDGRWGLVCRELWPSAHLTAVEPREEEAECLRRFCDVVHVATIEDAESTNRLGSYDLIADNPPFSLRVPGTKKPSQAEAMRAFLPLRFRLRTATSRLMLYWLTDLGQRSPAAVEVMAEHMPIEQWRIPLPVCHTDESDIRNYSIWHWSYARDRQTQEWRCSTLPILAHRSVTDGDMEGV